MPMDREVVLWTCGHWDVWPNDVQIGVYLAKHSGGRQEAANIGAAPSCTQKVPSPGVDGRTARTPSFGSLGAVGQDDTRFALTSSIRSTTLTALTALTALNCRIACLECGSSGQSAHHEPKASHKQVCWDPESLTRQLGIALSHHRVGAHFVDLACGVCDQVQKLRADLQREVVVVVHQAVNPSHRHNLRAKLRADGPVSKGVQRVEIAKNAYIYIYMYKSVTNPSSWQAQ